VKLLASASSATYGPVT